MWIGLNLKNDIMKKNMKKYSSARAGRGKTAYRTPSDFRFRHIKDIQRRKINQISKNK
jgi:hypothetical protein